MFAWVPRLAPAVAVVALAGCGSKAAPHAATRTATPAASVATAAPRPSAAPHLRIRQVGRLPAPVQLPAVTALPDGDVLALGGLDAGSASVDSIVRVRGGRARVAGRLPRAVHDATAATIDGGAYLFGGGDAGTASRDVLRIESSGARRVGELPLAASDVSAAVVDGGAYVVGGFTERDPLKTIVSFAPGRPSHVVARLPRPLRYASVAASGRSVVVAGGTSGTTPQRAILRLDLPSGRLRRIGTLPSALTHAAAAALGGAVYVLGGREGASGRQTDRVLAIDPATGRVRRAGRLPEPLSDEGAAVVAHHIDILGGRDAAGRARDSILTAAPAPAARPIAIPALLDPHDVYAAGRPGLLSPVARRARALVYVPNSDSNSVDVISQKTFKVVRHFATGELPQHVTPSYDLRTLWVDNDMGNSLTPIDPRTGRPGRPVPVEDPYNLYFTADGRRAIVVAEQRRRLDFRDPHSMRLRHQLSVPQCAGVDHMDFTADGRRALVSCEFAGRMIVVDLVKERVLKSFALRPGAMPQDVKLSPDGRTFYVADMASNGVWTVDARRMRKTGFRPTGRGAHGLYTSRDSRVLYVTNRGEGTISRLSFDSGHFLPKWRIPGGSPDMGGVSADGRVLWLSGRYSGEVYAISTRTGRLLHRIRVGSGPHGLCVWPQPGRYSIGHTGILR